MRYLLSVFIVAMTLLAPGAAMRGAAQEPERDVNRDRANAAATAAEILRLAGERKFNTMYDYMHPMPWQHPSGPVGRTFPRCHMEPRPGRPNHGSRWCLDVGSNGTAYP